MEKRFPGIDPGDRRRERFKRWLSAPGIGFATTEARDEYRRKVTRFIRAIELQIPDRVPFSLSTGFLPALYFGITPQEAMYDAKRLLEAWRAFHRDFESDVLSSPARVCSGRVLEILDCRIYRWAGHGLPDRGTFQYVEGEYMTAEEYDRLIADPSDFWMRIYLPRAFGSLAPLANLRPVTDLSEMPSIMSSIAAYGKPDVQSAFRILLEAGERAAEWIGSIGAFTAEMTRSGLPRLTAGMVKAPFDVIGDTLRGMQGIILDMYRRPDKVMEAMERLAPLEIQRGVAAADASGVPIVFIPLHKGADGFMSDRQFETFYWPPLKKVVSGLIEEGIVPMLFAEGGYNSRLTQIGDLPKGGVIWHFDRTDMGKAKEALGDSACIMGNIPASLLATGTPEEVQAYCRELMETAGRGGGFILAAGAVSDEARPDNVRAVIDAVRRYGVYGRAPGGE